MPSKFKSILGSNRPSYFRESKSRPIKSRSQKIKFRRRYASSVATEIGGRLWTLTKMTTSLIVLGASIYYGQILWTQSSFFKISQVRFVTIPPLGLPEFLGLKAGQNIFNFNEGPLEMSALSKFPELESIDIVRGLSRDVTVEIEYRKPLATLEWNGKKMAVDRGGVVFSLDEAVSAEKPQPELAGFVPGPDLVQAMAALSTVSQELPDFYSLIKIIKTDKMQPLRLVFSNTSVVYWGDLETETIVGRAKKVQHVFREFSPKKPLAAIRFVTDDRLVLDQNWVQKASKS